MRLYNTLSGELEELRPLVGKKVSMYVCGVTPYDSMHLGHARTYVAFDIMRRYLASRGFEVYFVQNVTDVDDKIIKRAKEIGEEPLALSARFDVASREDMASLNILKADVYPKVSGHLGEIVALIDELVAKGVAYANESGVYFEVAKYAHYGELSRQKMEEVRAGARVEVDEKKKHPADFALWKSAKEGELSFESKFGRGRPGWHIECSAMSMKYIGETVDIHGGARDLIFPHHENERAQSEAATGKRFVRYWCHTGFLTVNGEKMAKSLGNFITVRDMLKEHDANAIRLFFASTHYRSPTDFSRSSLSQAKTSVERVLNTLANADVVVKEGRSGSGGGEEELAAGTEDCHGRFIAAMDEDMDTPKALAALFELCHRINSYCGSGGVDAKRLGNAAQRLRGMIGVFGIVEKKAEALDSEVAGLIEEREQARKRKDYAKSDEIRKRLLGMGIALEDGKDGKVAWKRVKAGG